MITRINSLYDFHPVVNLGKISHDEVFEIYGRSKALLFPSLKESLGLPLIEANQLGLKVLVSKDVYKRQVSYHVQRIFSNQMEGDLRRYFEENGTRIVFQGVKGEEEDPYEEIVGMFCYNY